MRMPIFLPSDEKTIKAIYSNEAVLKYQRHRRNGAFLNEDIINPALRRMFPTVSGKRVLDIGCGYGEDAEWLLQKGAHVTGIDISKAMIDATTSNPRLHKARFSVGSIYTRHPRAMFDICLANMVLDQVEDLPRALSCISSALRTKGSFLFSVAHPFAMAIHAYTSFDGNYFSSNKTSAHIHGADLDIPYYPRSLETWVSELRVAGFVIECLSEPKPRRSFKVTHREARKKYSFLPLALIIHARKTS
jgi:2-polyprenyl-3-methyl-5-hydroxy-6-metoxy-1,4-benzoquinol methylase